VSALLMGRALWADLPNHLKLTAISIADAANDEGYAFPGQERIAKQLHQSVRQVRSNIRELEKRGFLSVVRRGRKGQNQSGGRTSNGYQLNIDALPYPPYRQSGLPVSKEISECSKVTGSPPPVSGEVTGAPPPVSEGVTGSPPPVSKDGYRKSSAYLPEVATSYEPSVEPSDKKEPKPASRISTCPRLEIPPNVDREAWDEFEQHRRDIRKPLTDLARRKNLKVLEGIPVPEQRRIIDNTIANRWTGLFPLNGKQAQTEAPKRNRPKL